MGGVTFAKESSESGTERHHYSFLNSSYGSFQMLRIIETFGPWSIEPGAKFLDAELNTNNTKFLGLLKTVS